MMRLSLYSKQCLNEIEQHTGINYTGLKHGTLHIFKDEKSLASSIKQAEFQKELGCEFEILPDRAACIAKAPSLTNSQKPIVGGLFFPLDESGDVHEFAVNLAQMEAAKTAKFMYDTSINNILTDGKKITGIETDKGTIYADRYIMSLGAYSPLLLRKIGIRLPIYPMKGYSISIPIANANAAPMTSITDQGDKVVYSRLGNILRVAGTAEFAGYDQSIRKERIDTLKFMTKRLFPDCGDIESANEWSCLRPSTPDGSPILGHSPYENLFLNTGQGTLGWTLACGSARIVADIIEGKEPDIDLTGLTIDRPL
jgi:D-amino-acid dehydrogenase